MRCSEIPQFRTRLRDAAVERAAPPPPPTHTHTDSPVPGGRTRQAFQILTMRTLTPLKPATQINAEKSPFLTDRLKIWMLPTLALVRQEKTVDYVVGFEDVGGTDDFPTSALAARLQVGKREGKERKAFLLALAAFWPIGEAPPPRSWIAWGLFCRVNCQWFSFVGFSGPFPPLLPAAFGRPAPLRPVLLAWFACRGAFLLVLSPAADAPGARAGEVCSSMACAHPCAGNVDPAELTRAGRGLQPGANLAVLTDLVHAVIAASM